MSTTPFNPGEFLSARGSIAGAGGHDISGGRGIIPSQAPLSGMVVGGDAYKELIGIGSHGIDIGTGSLDEIIPRSDNQEGVFSSDMLESLFGGILSPIGLPKEIIPKIRSLGEVLTLRGMAVSNQLKLNLKQNTSISSKGMQQE
jgi:hypothetical protein